MPAPAKTRKSNPEQMEGYLRRDAFANIGTDAIIDADARKVRLTVSTENPYLRRSYWEDDWVEVLGHKADEVDLSRVEANAAPLLYNHGRWERDDRIGIVDRAWIEDGKVVAEVRLSARNDEMDGIWHDVRSGILTNVSVGYEILERMLVAEREGEAPEYRVTKWQIREVSLVDIPADVGAGVGRSADDPDAEEAAQGQWYRRCAPDQSTNAGTRSASRSGKMPTPKQPENEPASTKTDDEVTRTEPNVVDQATLDDARQAARHQGREEYRAQEAARKAAVDEMFTGFDSPEHVSLRAEILADDTITPDDASKRLLGLLKAGQQDQATGGHSRAVVTETRLDRFVEGATQALEQRAGFVAHADLQHHEFSGMSLRELARAWLEASGYDFSRGSGPNEIISAVFNRATGGNHATGDFPMLLANIANKSMLMGVEEAEETFQIWTRAGNLTDFKPATRNDLNEAPSLRPVQEGAEYKFITLGERGVTIQLATYGELFSITRQMLINDDLDAMTRVPRNMGRAAIRTVGDLVYAVLTSNANWNGEATPLFDAARNNLAATGAPPSTDSLDAARTAMALQKGACGVANLNITPAHLLVPKALQGQSNVVLASETKINGTGVQQGNRGVPNAVQNMASVVSDSRLDDDSSTAWYLAASSQRYDVMEVAYLNGNTQPFMDEFESWNVDGRQYKVRMDAGVQAMDPRTLYKNAGV